MFLSGVQPFTLLDYPGKIACVAFLPGCNFRCGYCHNPEFVLPEKIVELKKDFIAEEIFFSFLNKRKNKLEAVVVSGGEPTVQGELLSFLRKIKAQGFLVKLDTNGSRPSIIQEIINNNLVDYIAMDLKTSLDSYESLAGDLAKKENILKSIEIIKASGLEYEFRSTIIKELHPIERLIEMGELIHGSEAWFLQNFRPSITLKESFTHLSSYTEPELQGIAQKLKKFAKIVEVRN